MLSQLDEIGGKNRFGLRRPWSASMRSRLRCNRIFCEVWSLFCTLVVTVILSVAVAGSTARGSSPLSLRAADAPWLPGVNLAGGEFAPSRSRIGYDYIYPPSQAIDYYAGKGLRVFRIPFLAARIIQPTLTEGPRLTEDMAILVSAIEHAASRKAYVILDMHDYGRIFIAGLIGRDAGAAEEFAAAWRLIANRVKDYPNVIFGLMNEPYEQTAEEWLIGANAAIAAIRAAGAKQMILVPGSYWSGAHSWVRRSNATTMSRVIDPAENFAFEVHQYLDRDSSGASSNVVEGAGATRLEAFTAWARRHKARAFLAEFGWADNPKAHAEGKSLLAHMSANRDVWIGWTYWAGGPWWGDYMFSIEPKDGADRPQMSVLEEFLK